MAIPFTKDQLGQTIRKGVDESGNPIGQIIGQPALSPQEYAMMNTRADVERGAQMERPTYGMWDGNTFVSTDPNEIAEMNARAEMKRTGLDRYYRPQSGPYFEAFNKIRDRYLQQELGKKAAVEAEGRAIVANRLGAFDKILQARAEAKKNEPLNEWRKAQAEKALAEAKAKEVPKPQKVEKQHRDEFDDAMFRHFAQWGDGLAKNINELFMQQVDDGKGGKTTFQNTMIKGTNIPVSDLYNRGKAAFETAISQGFNTGDALNIANTDMNRYAKGPTIKAPVAQAVTYTDPNTGVTYEKRQKGSTTKKPSNGADSMEFGGFGGTRKESPEEYRVKTEALYNKYIRR